MSPEQVVHDFVAAYSAHDFDRLRLLLTDDFVFRPEGDVRLPAPAYIVSSKAITDAFSDFTLSTGDYQVDGEKVIVPIKDNEATHTGRFAYPVPNYPIVEATGRRIQFKGFNWIFTVRENKIAELELDMPPNAGMDNVLLQMGVQPPQ